MNLLKRQGFFNSITLYLGTALGFFNLVILFQKYLTIEQIGYFSLLTAISVIYTQLSSLGFANVISRYFPYFKTDDKTHKGFPLFVVLVCLSGFVSITIFFLLFKETILGVQSDKKVASFMSKYYFYIIPVSFFSLAFLIQETFARAIFKNILPSFLREVILRALTTLGVFLIVFKWIDFKGFITFYLFANIFIFFILSLYTYRINIYKSALVSFEVKNQAPEMIKFGLFSMLGGGSFALIQSLDIIILKFLSSEAMIGYYSTFFMIASVISLPAKALNTTSYQLIADAWKINNLDKISAIYHKTSIVQFLLGSLMLVGLIINKDNILSLLVKPDKPYYADYFNVFIIVGIGFLIDITGGLNSAIISFSSSYKVVMRFLLLASLICCALNIVMIPQIGLTGAALSYSLTILFLNFGYWLFLKLKFNLQPFNGKYLLVIMIGIVGLITGLYIPTFDNFFVDVSIRSTTVAIIYAALTYYLNISEDINDLANKVLKRK